MFKKNLIVQSILFIGVGAGEKNTRSRSKTDRLRKTGHLLVTLKFFLIEYGILLDTDCLVYNVADCVADVTHTNKLLLKLTVTLYRCLLSIVGHNGS